MKEKENDFHWWRHEIKDDTLLTPGLDNTRLFMSLTAGAGTRCMSLLY